MLISKLILFDFKKSLNVKVLTSMLVAILTIILFMEISNIYVLDIYQKQAKNTYQNSLKLYSNYWDGKFDVINNSLATLVSTQYDNYFSNICNSDDKLTMEISKLIITNKLNEIVRMHNSKINTFTFIPDRNIYLKSSNNLVEYNERENLDNQIKNYIGKAKIKNNSLWELLKVGDNCYFIKVYHMQNGYVGAVVNSKTILDYLMEDKSIIGAAALVDENSAVVYRLETGISFDKSSESLFSEKLRLTNYKIGIIVSERTLYSDQTLFILIMIGIFIIGIIIVLINLRVQMKVVLNPLKKLKIAMEKFSSGDMDVRLEENTSSNEINTLYKTFNFMSEQISNLKIDVYESEIEKREIQSSFLRVQIQPHFYTNILNLICGLAGVGECKSIQKISIVTSNYFRYLLSTKNTFVTLDKEIECVKNYVEIQSIRYPELLDFMINSSVNADEQTVPPLILQTFVENSIKHNITYIPVVRVYVSIFEELGKLVISIADNGLGFSKDLLEKINSDENISEDGKHIGIVNVKQRLRLIYGDDAHITITSNTNETLVRIYIPGKTVGGDIFP